MKSPKNIQEDRSELSGFLFSHFGKAVGIDIVPFLATIEKKESTKMSMLKGRNDCLKSKKVKKKAIKKGKG